MRLLRALCVLMCVIHASAQTCVSGQYSKCVSCGAYNFDPQCIAFCSQNANPTSCSTNFNVCSNCCECASYCGSAPLPTCQSCPIGTYSSSNGVSVCTNCATGKSTVTTGATGCTDCQAGKYHTCQSDTTWEPAGGVYPEWIGRACELFVGYEQACEFEGGCPYCCECAQYCSNPRVEKECASCPSGKYSTVSAASVCTDCLAGKYSGVTGANYASVCSNCPANSYSVASGASACTACDAGKTATAGATACVSSGCAAGTYVSGGGCTNCAPGSYSTAVSASACTGCSAGTYSTATGASSAATCLACPASSYSPISSTVLAACTCNVGFTGPNGGVCSSCVAGKYKIATGSAVCTDCAAGTYSTATGASASATCLACPASSYSPISSAALAACTCNVGFTGPNGGPCTACVAGTYKIATGSAVCTNCLAGTYSGVTSASSASACVSCPAGTTSPSGSTWSTACVSTTCNAGFTGPNGGPCTVCVAGKYKTTSGSAACTDCGAGSYSTSTAATISATCIQCPSNSISYSASSAAGDCTCNAGFTGPNGGPCTACVAGKYKTTSGSAACTDCFAASYSTSTGATIATTCITCPSSSISYSASSAAGDCTCNAGFTGPNGGVCSACVAGKYKINTGSVACTDCLAGSFSTSTGATLAATCQACQANATSAAGSVGQEYCYCKSGYAHAAGAYTCRICDPGTYNSQLGRTACSNCSVGLYSVHYGAVGNETCLSCPLGQWSPEGSPSCNLCPVNSRSATSSGFLSKCICDAGYTGPNGGLCSACVAGQYKNMTGTSACMNCTAGAYSSVTAASACTSCPVGVYSRDGASSCTLYQTCLACPANTYYTEGACIACPGNSSSSTASLVCQCNAGFTGTPGTCQACPAGTYKRMAGTSACRSCQPNSRSDAASVLCACNPGYTANTGDVCVACVTGTYKNLTGPSACVACAQRRNSVAAATNVTSCICDVSYTQVENEALAYDAVYAQACVACDVGKFKPVIGVQACTTCGLNQFSVTASPICSCIAGFTGPDGGPCAECALGKYKDWLGSQACTTCPANSYTPVTGNTRLINCTCNIGYTGPNGVACPACVGGKYKNVTGSSVCLSCSADFYSTLGTAATSCTACKSGFKSLSVSGDVADCCDPNTTIARSPFFTLSAATQAALGYYYSVRVSSTPLFGLRSMTSTVSKGWGPFGNLLSPIPTSVAPTYIPSGGFNNQAYLSFRRTPNVQYMDTDEVPITFENGMTFVTVVRFLDYDIGMRYLWVGSLVSFMFPDRSLGFEVYLTDRGFPHGPFLCVGRGYNYFNAREWANAGQTDERSICTARSGTAGKIPFNEWLTVTFTYDGNSNPLHTLKVTYQLPTGVEVVVASTSAFVNGGLQNTPTMAQTLSWINSPTYACNYVNGECWGNGDFSKFALGYNTNLQCMQHYHTYIMSDIAMSGCGRPNFDLAGLYLIQTKASTADIAVIVEAIRSGSQLAYDKTYCPCNAGFGGTGRSDCKSCSPGSYNSEVRSAPCSPCPAKMYSNAVEATDIGSCLSCPQNSVSIPGETICFCASGFTGPDFGPCVPCEAGQYKNWRNASECVACPPNSDSVPGTSLCPCNVGYTGPLGGPCIACVAGKYKDTNGTTPCTTCPANSYEPDIAAVTVTNCTCNTGFDGADGGPCTGCALGKYKNNNDTTPCVECPTDTYIDVQSSAYCKTCPEFTTSPVGSGIIDACICKLGYTGGGGTVTVGVSSSNLGRSCGPNSNQACPSAASTTRGGTPSMALDDNVNTLFITEGNLGVDQWFKIDFGRVVIVQSFKIVVIYSWEVDYQRNIKVRVGNVDSYSSLLNPTCYEHAGSLITLGEGVPGWTRTISCTTPRAGQYLFYVNPPGLNYIEFGEFSPIGFSTPPQTACVACVIGKYKDAIGSALCSYCPLTTFSGATNATSIDTCAACPGNSTSLLGSASKDYCQCNTGFVHEGAGCSACLPGTYNPRLAEIACSNCTVGTSSLNYGAVSNETCASCRETEYSLEGSPFCEPCPPNSVAPARSSRIQDCGCTYGYTGPTESLCVKCAPGGYKNITGNYLCETCSVNSYSLSGATALTACFCNPGYTGAYGPLCVECVLGKYKSAYGSAACTDCAVNTYADRTGMTSCTSCVNTSASPVGSVTIWNCTCNAGYKGPTYEEVVYNDNFARSCAGSACATTQSSTLTTQVMVGIFDSLNPANFANDNSSATFSTTAYGTGQWWRVDFERRVTVQAVRVLFSSYAFDVLHVLVGDANSSTANLICATVAVNISSTDWVSATCAAPLTGRYLYVRNSITSQVTMKEIRVQGTEVLTKIWPDWCEKCPLGTYKSVTGSSPCVSCPSNKFSATLASTSISACLSCPSNSVAAIGSDQCVCDVGFSGSVNACTACDSDTFKTQVGESTCEICPANSVIASNASTSAMPCTCLSGYQPS